MTDREAIVAFEKQLHSAQVVLDSGFGTHPGESDSLYRRRKEMAEAALSALQEREERRKGCECCNQHNALELGAKVYNQSVSYYIVGDGYPHSEKHRFCPMCGRDLKTAMPGEEQHG